MLAFALTASQARAAYGDTVYRFADSEVEVVTPDSGRAGAFVKHGDTETWITRDPLLHYPINQQTYSDPAWAQPYEAHERVALLVTENGVWVVTPNGAVHPVPIDLKKTKVESIEGRSGPHVNTAVFEYGGHSHVLVSGYYKDSEQVGPHNGETFLVRDDGLSFRLALGAVTLRSDGIKVTEDGLLHIESIPRAIDLDKLELEAQLPIGAPFIVKDAEGQPIENAIEKANAEFPDMLEQIRNGSLRSFSFLPGEEATVEAMRLALAQEESGSLVLLGESGSGKSQLGYSFLTNVVRNAYPEIPRSIRVVSLDRGLLEGGTKFLGTFEAKVALLKYLSRWAPIYLFADEMHALRGAGTHSGSKVDVFDMIKPELASGSIRIIGTSTDTEFANAFAGNTAILRRIPSVKMPTRDEAQTIEALKSWMARFKKPTASDEVLRAVYRTSERFSATGVQPAKSSKLLDYAFASLKVKGKSGASLTVADVQVAAQHLYRLSPTHFDPMDAVRRHQNLRPALDVEIIGQTAYKDALVHANGMQLAHLQDARRPGLKLLVVGTTGVGKTATAEAYAQAKGATYVRVEMSKYQGRGADVEAFRRELAEALRKDAAAVICLDEIEKAAPEVLLGLLSIFDDGYFNVMESIDSSSSSQSSTSVRVNTARAEFIATSNATADWVAAVFQQRAAKKPIGFMVSTAPVAKADVPVDVTSVAFQQALRNQLITEGFPSPLLGRIPVVTVALPPTPDEFKATVRLHTEKRLAALPTQGASTFTIANWDAFLDAMVARYYVGVVQNRIVHSLLDTHLNPVLLHVSLEEMGRAAKGGGNYTLTWTNQGFQWASDCEGLLLPEQTQ